MTLRLCNCRKQRRASPVALERQRKVGLPECLCSIQIHFQRFLRSNQRNIKIISAQKTGIKSQGEMLKKKKKIEERMLHYIQNLEKPVDARTRTLRESTETYRHKPILLHELAGAVRSVLESVHPDIYFNRS